MSDLDDRNEPARDDAPRRRRWEADRRPDDRPRRRQFYDDERDDYDDQYGYPGTLVDPRQKVQGPGIALIIIGWIGVLCSLAFVVIGVVMSLEEARRPPPGNRGGEPLVFAVLFAVGGMLSAVASLVVAIGGARMRQCRSYGLCMTAAILVLASFVLLGLCSVLALPFGIWALVVLCQSDVKREFDRGRRSYVVGPREGWE